MFGYLIRRLLALVLVLLFVALITFALMHIAPGGPWDRERRLDPAVEANLDAKYHLDQPLPIQFVQYLLGLLHGDLGLSFTNPGFSVQEVIGRGLAVTVQLGLLAAALALAVGVPLGVLAALEQNSLLDYGSTFFALLGYARPSLVLGIFLFVLFAVHWRALPPGGWARPAAMILPVITLAAAPTAILARYARASMLDIRGQDYVLTPRSKGLRERTVVVQHMMRNAL